MDKLTPAQECAVDLIRWMKGYRRPSDPTKQGVSGDVVIQANGFTYRSICDIISRYIREAEQRGREEAANGIMEYINEHKDKWYRKDLMTQLTYLEISAIAVEFIALAEAPHD